MQRDIINAAALGTKLAQQLSPRKRESAMNGCRARWVTDASLRKSKLCLKTGRQLQGPSDNAQDRVALSRRRNKFSH
jgi:hypothetical protein